MPRVFLESSSTVHVRHFMSDGEHVMLQNTSVISRNHKADKYVKTHGDKVTVLYIEFNMSRYSHVSTLRRTFRFLLGLIIRTI